MGSSLMRERAGVSVFLIHFDWVADCVGLDWISLVWHGWMGWFYSVYGT